MGSIVAEIADKVASAGGGERSELEVRGGVGASGGGILTLSTSELTVVDGDILGRIDFQAPLETGTDAIVVSASIYAEADDTFAADNNSTELVFAVGASEAAAEKMRLDHDGQLGIGVATPASLLHVAGTVQVGVDDTGHDVKFFGASAGAFMLYDESEDTLEIRGASADATTSTGKLLLSTALNDINDNDVLGRIDFKAPLEAGTGDSQLLAASIHAEANATFSSTVNATDLVFSTGASEAATEKMRILSDGKVGIGKTPGSEKLEVNGSIAVYDAVQSHQTSALVIHQVDSTTSEFRAYGADGTTAGALRIRGYANDGSPFNAGITLQADGQTTNALNMNVLGTNAVKTYGDGAPGDTNTEFVTMSHNGGGGFLQTAQTGTGTIRTMLIRAGTGGQQLTSGATGWTTPSDRRLKTNISALGDSLIKINTIEPVSFKWKENDVDSEGFIAQDIFKIIPEVVTEGNDEVHEEDSNGCWKKGDLKNPWGVSKDGLIPFMVKAIQELSAKVKALEDA